MNISTKITNDGKRSIMVGLSTEESDRICAEIVCNGGKNWVAAMPMILAMSSLPIDDVNEQVAECERTTDTKHAAQLLVLKLLQARRILREQQNESN